MHQMELDTMFNSRIENKVLLRQMGAGLVNTKRVLVNNTKMKSSVMEHPAPKELRVSNMPRLLKL